MLDGDLVQLLQPLRLRNTIIDHDGVDVLHVGDTNELVDGGVIALVAFERRVGDLPLLMRHAEESYIQHIRFARVDDVHLSACDGGGNEILLDGIRMDAVVDLREFPLRRPTDKLLLLRLETLKLLDKIQLELNREPCRELKRDITPRIRSAIAP